MVPFFKKGYFCSLTELFSEGIISLRRQWSVFYNFWAQARNGQPPGGAVGKWTSASVEGGRELDYISF